MQNCLPTADNLTHWLRNSGALPHGKVLDVQITLEHKTDISKLVFLDARYSSESPTDLPCSLVVKSPLKKTNTENYAATEVQFYRSLAPVLKSPPLVRCVATIEGDGECSGTIVLEDLRATHDQPAWPLPPSKKQCELAIDALLSVHAQFWEAPDLGNTIGQCHTTESLITMVRGIAADLPAFLNEIGDSTSVEVRRIYEKVFASSLKPWMRLIDRHALTIVHGDAYTWNFLFPRSDSGAVFLIDWQLCHVDVGARDLAFFMAFHWDDELRRELESPLIQRYYEGLLQSGIRSYTLDDLRLDYRRCVVRNLTLPILFWKRGMKRENWWHRLEFALAAYQDLRCDELL
jgi:hypothetical protein